MLLPTNNYIDHVDVDMASHRALIASLINHLKAKFYALDFLHQNLTINYLSRDKFL
jgi:hypothetical protein